MYPTFLFFLLFSILACDGDSKEILSFIESLFIPSGIQQLLFVTTPSWEDFKGTLRLCSRTRNGWKVEGEGISVVIGRNGFAWGKGVFESDSPRPQKIEGDGKSPAGIFDLGTSFGSDPQEPSGSIYPYRQATGEDYFIDDVDAPEYNQWISLADSTVKNPKQYWESFEKMKRNDDLYEFGVVVRHNMDPVVKGKGSAIFLHVWRDSDQPTAGCTAMSKENMLSVIRWLDPAKNPILIQLPEEVLTNGFLSISR